MSKEQFSEFLASYMYLKGQRFDDEIRVAVDNLHRMKYPDQDHVEQLKGLLYRKAEFELTCREVKSLLRLYLV